MVNAKDVATLVTDQKMVQPAMRIAERRQRAHDLRAEADKLDGECEGIRAEYYASVIAENKALLALITSTLEAFDALDRWEFDEGVGQYVSGPTLDLVYHAEINAALASLRARTTL